VVTGEPEPATLLVVNFAALAAAMACESGRAAEPLSKSMERAFSKPFVSTAESAEVSWSFRVRSTT